LNSLNLTDVDSEDSIKIEEEKKKEKEVPISEDKPIDVPVDPKELEGTGLVP